MNIETLAAPRERTTEPATRRTYRCECGHVLRVFGGGRHRVYFDPSNTALDDPMMSRACPECGRGLKRKNA